MSVDANALAVSLRQLAERGAVKDVVPALQEVIEACVALFGATGSGIMIADDQNITRYVVASDGPGRVLETHEAALGEGPCTDAFVDNHAVATSDVTIEDRWPRLAAAMAGTEVRGILGVPITLGGVTVGTLDLYRDEPYEWSEAERTALIRFADVVAATLSASLRAHTAGELAGQLTYALEYRVVIERGVGYLMARDRLDSVTAFNKLRQAARSTRSKIGAVAEALLTNGQLPGELRS